MNLEVGRIAKRAASGMMFTRLWRPSRRILRLRMLLSLVSIDTACIMAGFLIGGLICGALFGTEANQGMTLGLLILPIYFGIALNSEAFSTEIFSEGGRGASRALRALALSVGMLTLVVFYLKIGTILSRATLGIGSVLALSIIMVARSLFLRHASSLLGANLYSTVLISDGMQVPTSGQFSAYISADSWLDPENDCPAMYDRLAKALLDADRVVINCGPERRQAWVNALKGANIRSEVVTPELADLAPMGSSYWGGMPTLIVADGPLSGADALIKRCFDLVMATMALIALSPLMLVVAALVKLESPGPVFFIQTRIGLGNRHFKMYKFRSMRTECSDATGSVLTSRNDNRVTKVGEFIRKTSIDELPQLLNVLMGQMSIVGPRPHALGAKAADKLYWEVDPRYWHRHAAKPGLTGFAQVSGFRGNTEREADLTNRLNADLEYLHQWSIWRDLLIIIRTVGVMVHRNAF